MAEGHASFQRKEPSLKPDTLQDTEQEVKCLCCDKQYINPVYLPCGHTISKQCMKKQRPVGKCIICKQPFNVKAHEFPRNRLFGKLASIAKCREIQAKLKRNRYCNFDEDHIKKVLAHIYCAMCKYRLCQKCKTLHDKVPESRKHDVYYPESERHEMEILSRSTKCDFHKDQEIVKWCSDCHLPACAMCCPCEHNLIDISKAAKDAEAKLRLIQRSFAETLFTVKTQQKCVERNGQHLKGNEIPGTGLVLRYNVIKNSIEDVHIQTYYLLYEINLLLSHGGDIDKLSALLFILEQQKAIQKCSENIESRPDSTSSSSTRSSLEDSDSSRNVSFTDTIQSAPGKETDLPYQNESFHRNRRFSDRRKAVNPREFESSAENIYSNEENYEETQVQLRNPSSKKMKEITEKCCQFDTETRLTGMTISGDVIIVASQSAGMCSGFGTQGELIWNITEKLDGPFDLDAYKTDAGKHLLFISDPGNPGKREESKSTVRVFEKRANNRYTHLKCFTMECFRPKGICVFAGRVYLCEPQRKEVTEYQICDDFTGKVVKRYNEEGVLMEPLYVTAQVVRDKMFLLVSDKHMGLKRLIKGDSGKTHPGWAVTKEKTFTPSKCFVTDSKDKKEVFLGNTSGRKLHLINFEPRQVSHTEYSLDGCNGPVAVAVNGQGQIVVACKDGSVILYTIKEVTEMKRMGLASVEEEENAYDL